MKQSTGLVGCALLFVFVNLLATEPWKDLGQGIDGFSSRGEVLQRQIEKRFQTLPRAENCRLFLQRLTEKPHMAGTPENYELALYVRDKFKEFGLEEVELVEYSVLLSYPREIRVEMVAPESFEASLREEVLVPGEDRRDEDVSVGFHAYSASGDVTAELVYAHGGNPEDYDELLRQGIDVRGKIALVRYSMPYSYRGYKVLTAQERGAAALLIYSDPLEDGYSKGEVYPRGPWGPDNHIQRGSVAFDFIVPGDPLTPGWASLTGARRLKREESEILPKIMSVPLSAQDVRPLLENLRGPVAPPEWQGGLPLTYHLGPGPTKVHIKVEMDDSVRSIWNVVGKVRGESEPDRWVIVGNHRDAWVYGAVDPSSGTASLLELARAMGELLDAGYRPKRSVLFCNWDAEEYTLTGSTEWVEQWAESLAKKAVAYINVDSSTCGPDLDVVAVPSLKNFIPNIARETLDPGTGTTVLEAWEKRKSSAVKQVGTKAVELTDTRVGSGSDHAAFLNFVGVPIIGMTFDGPYGVYHSRYDNFYWMSQFGDPTFRYHETMARIWGLALLRLANADILPFHYNDYAEEIDTYVRELQPEVSGSLAPAVNHLIKKLGAFRDVSQKLDQQIVTLLTAEHPPEAQRIDTINDALMKVERSFCLPEGIPGRPWYKHLVYACKYNYDPQVLPGLTEAAEQKNWKLATDQIELLIGVVDKATHLLARAVGP